MKVTKGTPTRGLQTASVCAVGAMLIAASVGLSQTKPPENTPNKPASTNLIYSVRGADLYRAHCASCHGLNGKGEGPAALALKTKPANLTLLSQSNRGDFPAAIVKKTISGEDSLTSHGSRDMPIWGPIFHQIENDQDFGDVRLVNLTKYLQSIQQK